MCVCNSDKSKYEVIVCDNSSNYICTINFASITTVCRFLEDFNFMNSKIDIYRKKDSQKIDVDMLISIWNSDFKECED